MFTIDGGRAWAELGIRSRVVDGCTGLRGRGILDFLLFGLQRASNRFLVLALVGTACLQIEQRFRGLIFSTLFSLFWIGDDEGLQYGVMFVP